MSSITPGSAANGWNAFKHKREHLQHVSFLSSGSLRRRLAIALSALLGVWLLSPLGGMVHVEGFSASIDSLALHLAHGTLLDYDRQFPFNLDYFVATRAGVVVALAALHYLAPDAGEWPFRVVMLIGFAGVVAGTVVLVRRWTGLNGLYAAVALLLMPGVSESGFFFNDNVISSGLAVMAMALLVARSSRTFTWRAFASGILLGAAIACRSDALLVAPAIVGILWTRRAGPRVFVAGLAWVAVGVLIVFAALYAAFGLTLLDSLGAAHRAVLLWSRGPSLKAHVLTLLFFLGVPGVVLGAIGLGVLARGRDRVVAATVIGTLLLYNLAYLGKAWEVRSFLPMTPFFAVLVCLGVQWAIRRASRVERAALVFVIVVVMIAPPIRIATHDGPREVVGRLWSPFLWTAWQRERRADEQGFERFARGLTARPDSSTLVVTSNWNADRYLHLALQDAGFVPVATAGPTRCASLVETVARGPVVVRHLRLHVPFVAIYPAYVPARYDAFVASCGGQPDEAVYLASLATLHQEGLGDRATAFSTQRVASLALLPLVTTEPDGVATLDGPALSRLRSSWGTAATNSIAADGAALPALLPVDPRAIARSFAPSLERLHAR